ncbi:putative NACHT domain-containing protein [Rosellinia necatrix]|uniref:Putative NACHT domain-containing protein n=1 Tax=Rosellinia necatrix TaxID=77044 RepID=A0A1W2TNF2_ROSNE|nr:putative NACHT domain-containing protein [Rosellinia necatrix]
MRFAPVLSPQAKQAIEDAFSSLEQTISPAESRNFANTTLQDVRLAAIQLEQQLAARRCLRNMRRLEPLFNGLEHYTRVVEVVYNGTPYLAWIWAPITLVLGLASEYVEAFEKIVDAYSRIAESLKRFEHLNKAFASNKDFQQTLTTFYTGMLEFHENAYKITTRNGWKKLFITSWGRFQRRFDHTLERMKRHESLIDNELNARNIIEGQKMREEIREWRKNDLERIERLEKDEAGKHYRSIASWLKVNDSEQQVIYDTLYSEGQSYPGTCTWALENKKLQVFLQGKSVNQILWLQGVAGSGKSVLTAEIIASAESKGYCTLKFLCSSSHRSNTFDQVLKSLLLQLLRKDSELVANVYRETIAGKPPPSITALEKLFHKVLMSMRISRHQDDYIWVFVDGLNECDIKAQTKVVNLISVMISNATRSKGIICKVFISSRASEMLSKQLHGKETLSLTEEKSSLSQAIKQYTSQRLQSLAVKLDQLSMTAADVDEVEHLITRKSDGMFLYARLILDYLEDNIFLRASQVISGVNDLPEKLSDFYRQILSQTLAHLNPQSVNCIKIMFGWIAFAKRPLKIVELLSAMAFSEGDYSVTSAAPEFILGTCNTLVEEKSDTTLTFIHNSVQEFLESSASNLPITEIKAIEEQGIATLACLISGVQTFSQHFDKRIRILQVGKGLHALHIYATEYWTDYLLRYMELTKMHDSSSKLINLANELSQRLDGLIGPAFDGAAINKWSLDCRLELLKPYPIIETQAKVAMRQRSIKNLEAQSEELAQALESADNEDNRTEHGLEAVLSMYQKTINFLLAQEEYPGLSTGELERFKLHFRTSVHTCRFSSCPRATLGFKSKRDLLEHETAHLCRVACPVTECQYPPFFSKKALQNHARVHHNNATKQRSIRRVGALPKPANESLFRGDSSQRRLSSSTEGHNYTPSLADWAQIEPAFVGGEKPYSMVANANPFSDIEERPMNGYDDIYAYDDNYSYDENLMRYIEISRQRPWPGAGGEGSYLNQDRPPF